MSEVTEFCLEAKLTKSLPPDVLAMLRYMLEAEEGGRLGFYHQISSQWPTPILMRSSAGWEALGKSSEFCASVVWWDENLALEMAELFAPTAQQVLAKDPVEGFHQLSQDFASTVLRVFDVLGVYVGKLKPTPRQWTIARRICAKLDPKQVAEHLSTVRPRNFQSAGFFLHFLCRSAPWRYEAVLRQLDWDKLDSTMRDDWENMPHDTEVLLSALYLRPPTRHFVQKLISDRTERVVHFPPRLMLMVPEIGLAHLAKGGSLRLAPYNHPSWEFGGIALALIAAARPELVERATNPFVDAIARTDEL